MTTPGLRRSARLALALSVCAVGTAVSATAGGAAARSMPFDIWGSVYGANGSAVVGATVSDGARVTTTDASGGYRLFEALPGSYVVTASTPTGCAQTVRVNDGVLAATAGGTRQDFQLSCA
jgi:hypothetical protein